MAEEKMPKEKKHLYHVKIVAEVVLEVPVLVTSRMNAMEEAEQMIQGRLRAFDEHAEVIGKSVAIRDGELK